MSEKPAQSLKQAMKQTLEHYLYHWLEKTLLPLALDAAGLPPETTFEQLETMDIPLPDSDPYPGAGNHTAAIKCAENFLFGSLILAAKMAGTQRAELLRDRLQGLIWRDAVAYGEAVCLYQDLSVSGFLDGETINRLGRAEELWARWEATDAMARKALDDYLYDYVDTQHLYQWQRNQ